MRKNFASLAFGATSLFLLLGSSCSLVYNLSPDQCSSNGDCVARFGQGHTCNLGICTTGSPGASGKGGGSGQTGGASGDAGESETGATGGKSETGGTGGNGTVAECKTHKDCFSLYLEDSEENPRACVDGTCVPLMTPDCPAVLPLSDNGKWNLLKSTDAIILGAYAPINGTTIDTIGNNYDLAVTELSDTTRGVLAGAMQRRQVVVVLCNDIYSTQDELLAPSKHLMEELKVPGVVGALFIQDQAYVWENVARDNGVFMMMPLPSNQELIDTPDDGLIWHMLSGANQLSVSYQPLLDKTVGHLKALGTLGASENLKVAHVKAKDEAFLQDTAAYLEANLKFNGQSVSANLDADLYKPIQITSAISAPTDEQKDAIDAIIAFAPHLVIGTTASEMLNFIIPGVESGWKAANGTQKRPFYLLGASDYNDPAMAAMINNSSPLDPVYKRILGVNWPAAVDQSVYEDYQSRWISAHSKRQDGYENFYDAMYYLLYGVAASRSPLTGKALAKGILRVTASGTKIPQVDVGPTADMVTYVTKLGNDATTTVELIGALGPPNWDAFGGRNDPASVWCVDNVGNYKPDQLRYDASSSALQPSDATLTNSEISCFTFPAQ